MIPIFGPLTLSEIDFRARVHAVATPDELWRVIDALQAMVDEVTWPDTVPLDWHTVGPVVASAATTFDTRLVEACRDHELLGELVANRAFARNSLRAQVEEWALGRLVANQRANAGDQDRQAGDVLARLAARDFLDPAGVTWQALERLALDTGEDAGWWSGRRALDVLLASPRLPASTLTALYARWVVEEVPDLERTVIWHDAAGPEVWQAMLEADPSPYVINLISENPRALADTATRDALWDTAVDIEAPETLARILRSASPDVFRDGFRTVAEQSALVAVQLLERATDAQVAAVDPADVECLLAPGEEVDRLRVLAQVTRLTPTEAPTPRRASSRSRSRS